MQKFRGTRSCPEKKIREDLIEYLVKRGWFVKTTHGNMFQSGFPDLYATHPLYGPRWIEVKLPEMKGSHFTSAQMKDFPKFQKHGSPIWVLVAATDDEYCKLFKESNFHLYVSLYH